MKRIVLFGILAVLLVLSCFVSPLPKAFAASVADNSVITLSGSTQGNKVVIKANLVENPGINGMTLTLSYDKSAMSLFNYSFGSALASLDPIATGTETETSEFKINYLGGANDYTTGTLVTFTFNLSSTISDGSYLVALTYKKNSDVTYLDNAGKVHTKNLYIDNAEVVIKDSSVIDIVPVKEDRGGSSGWIIALCVSIAVVIGGGVFVAFKFFRKQRNWERI